VITVDCGIRAVEPILELNDRGIAVIVLDHHIPGAELPPADAVVDPVRQDSRFPFKGMAAVGVTFYFLIALRRAMRQAGVLPADGGPELERFLDLVALGTIADSVPLIEENRVFAAWGLREIGGTARPGIAALRGLTGLQKGRIRAGHVGFVLAPRLNAAGRLETAYKALDLLTAGDLPSAVRLARELDGLNQERRDIEQDVLDEAMTEIERSGALKHRGLVVWGHWHMGVIGIVASRLVEAYHRPVIVLSVISGEEPMQ